MKLNNFSTSLLIFILGCIGFIFGKPYQDESKLISSTLVIIVTLLIAQGYAHQIFLIIRSGNTGAVDLKMSQFILMMDISTVFFSLSMGLNTGWPLLLLATVSGLTKLIIMYLFRWVKINKLTKTMESLKVSNTSLSHQTDKS